MTEAKEACIHHWVVEAPKGVTSKGTCNKCGNERDFDNVPEYMMEGQGNQWRRENKSSWLTKKGLDKAKG